MKRDDDKSKRWEESDDVWMLMTKCKKDYELWQLMESIRLLMYILSSDFHMRVLLFDLMEFELIAVIIIFITGVNFMLRKLAGTAKPTTEISKDGDEYHIKTTTTFKTTEIKFKLNEPFDEETADGRKCKVC